MPVLAGTVAECFKEWLKREKGPLGRNLRGYLQSCNARTEWGKIEAAAAGRPQGVTLNVETIAAFLRKVQMSPEALVTTISMGTEFPFQDFRQGSKITVFIAKRLVRNSEGEGPRAGWERAGHGSRDVQAVADLINVLRGDFHLDFELDLVAVPARQSTKMTIKQAKDAERKTKIRAREAVRDEDGATQKTVGELKEVIEQEDLDAKEMLEKAKGSGAIVSLGSGPHNPVSNVIAKRIFDHQLTERPVEFRWPSEQRWHGDFLRENKEVFKDLALDYEAGMWCIQNAEAAFLYRETDDFVRRYKIEKKTPLRTFFYDSGLLAIDTREKAPLILAAGQGGNGTRACVQALGRLNDPRLKILSKAREKAWRNDRFVGCLVVARQKSDKDVDDLTLATDPSNRRPWYFWQYEEPPDAFGLPENKPKAIPIDR